MTELRPLLTRWGEGESEGEWLSGLGELNSRVMDRFILGRREAEALMKWEGWMSSWKQGEGSAGLITRYLLAWNLAFCCTQRARSSAKQGDESEGSDR